MTWLLTQSRTDFVAAADQYMRADPVRNTVPLTVLEALRQGGLSTFGDGSPVFGWHESASGDTDGAFLQTPPFPVLVAGLPPGSSEALVQLLAGRKPTGANLPEEDAPRFSAAWAIVTGGRTSVGIRMRLFQLGQLVRPSPGPPGAARAADQSDFDLLVRWNAEFVAETGSGSEDAARTVTDRLSYGGITVWQDGGRPVATASVTRHVAGVCRVSSVYTAPEHRKHGYGGGITAAVSQQALDDGAAAVVLYTDLANPTSNALYQRLGFRPVAGRVAVNLL
jgi:GNAT superfamily N-acetyltransferase